MEYLKVKESIMNCPICCDSESIKKHKHKKVEKKNVNFELNRLWHHRYMSVAPEQSYDNLVRNKMLMQKCSIRKNGCKHINHKLLKAAVTDGKKLNHKNKKHTAVTYQVYTLTTNNNKLNKKPSKTVYSYPYSSSSSDTSASIFENQKKKLITIIPNVPNYTDDDDDDSESEYSTCNKFPITEKHYRHILDGIKCSSREASSSSAKKKFKEEKNTTKKLVNDFNEINFKHTNALKNLHEIKVKKKCKCKNKCKVEVKNEKSDSEFSEKTFIKFINSLHSYVNKTKKLSDNKCKGKQLDNCSSCSLCEHEEALIKKKKSSKEHDDKKHHHHHHHRHRHHHHSHHKKDTEDTSS